MLFVLNGRFVGIFRGKVEIKFITVGRPVTKKKLFERRKLRKIKKKTFVKLKLLFMCFHWGT